MSLVIRTGNVATTVQVQRHGRGRWLWSAYSRTPAGPDPRFGDSWTRRGAHRAAARAHRRAHEQFGQAQ